MMKRGFILLAVLVLISMPIMTSAQTTEFQVANSSIYFNMDGFDVALTVNWHSVVVVLRIDGDFYEEGWFDGPDNTYLFFWLRYDCLGVDAGETGELTIELSNTTRVHMEDDWLLERPECVLTFVFSVPWPEVNEGGVTYAPPHDYDEGPDFDFGIEPIPFEDASDFISHNQWPILMLVFGVFLVILGIALGPAPEKEEKTRKPPVTVPMLKRKLELLENDADWNGGVGEEYDGVYYAIKMSNVYPYPEEEAIELPDLSSSDDGEDWRACPYCGEWNHGETTRCKYCDGRLGRPLGR